MHTHISCKINFGNLQCFPLRDHPSATSRKKQPLAKRFQNGALIVILLPFILPLALFSIVLFLLYTATLYLLIWALWLPSGKDTLFVHSDSPIWHDYLSTQVLLLVQDRAVVLNWSDRKKWRWSQSVAAFHRFGGGRDFNPLFILFRPFHTARVFRFWTAFKDAKHGYSEPLERLRRDLVSALHTRRS